jgi:hypothetical protein
MIIKPLYDLPIKKEKGKKKKKKVNQTGPVWDCDFKKCDFKNSDFKKCDLKT